MESSSEIVIIFSYKALRKGLHFQYLKSLIIKFKISLLLENRLVRKKNLLYISDIGISRRKVGIMIIRMISSL